MKHSIICFLVLMISLSLGITSVQAENGSLLPDGIEKRSEYEIGTGNPIATVEMLQGKAWIIHENTNIAFAAKKELPLFQGDAIITQSDSRVRIILSDGSIVTIASDTRLVLNRSVFDPSEKTRSSFFAIPLGKARFWIRKLISFRKSDVSIKTRTAIVGVRGSDFTILAQLNRTEIVSFDKTKLLVSGLASFEEKPMPMDENQIMIVEKAKSPGKPDGARRDYIRKLKRELPIPDELKNRGSDVFKEIAGKTIQEGVNLSPEKIVPPDDLTPPGVASRAGIPESSSRYGSGSANGTRNHRDEIVETLDKTVYRPEFPPPPRENGNATGTSGSGGL